MDLVDLLHDVRLHDKSEIGHPNSMLQTTISHLLLSDDSRRCCGVAAAHRADIPRILLPGDIIVLRERCFMVGLWPMKLFYADSPPGGGEFGYIRALISVIRSFRRRQSMHRGRRCDCTDSDC
jgi:hypothetical protein